MLRVKVDLFIRKVRQEAGGSHLFSNVKFMLE